MKNFMNKIIRYFAQKYANFIIKQLENCKTEQELLFWMEQGLKLDNYCVINREIYLD